jgi:hypothetical protein
MLSPSTPLVLGRATAPETRHLRARALRFEVGGRVVCSKLVHYPGTDANDLFDRALYEGR